MLTWAVSFWPQRGHVHRICALIPLMASMVMLIFGFPVQYCSRFLAVAHVQQRACCRSLLFSAVGTRCSRTTFVSFDGSRYRIGRISGNRRIQASLILNPQETAIVVQPGFRVHQPSRIFCASKESGRIRAPYPTTAPPVAGHLP